MHYEISAAAKFRGRWNAVGDKSLTHRAFIFNALARGRAVIGNANSGEDCARTREILKQLGVEIEQTGRGSFAVEGRAGRFRTPEGTLDAGNSGTTMRLMAGLLAGQDFTAELDGDASLRRRPMARIAEPLRALGATVDCAEEDRPPLRIKGAGLGGCQWESPVASAQVKSAFLLAALQAEGESAFREPWLSRDHSERLLARMGVELAIEEAPPAPEHEREDADAEDADTEGVDTEGDDIEDVVVEGVSQGARPGWIRLGGPQELRAVDCEIPGDISSAAFLLAGGILNENGNVLIKNLGVNPTRVGFLNLLERMGAKLALYNPREEMGEPVADVLVHASHLEAVRIEGEELPSLIDEIPILAVLAACAKGESRFHDLGELRHKESDRLARTAEMLETFGGKVEIRGDGLIIQGGGRRRGAEFDAQGDHRLAMAASIMALNAKGASRITGVDCVGTSFPEFPGLIRRFSRKALQVVSE